MLNALTYLVAGTLFATSIQASAQSGPTQEQGEQYRHYQRLWEERSLPAKMAFPFHPEDFDQTGVFRIYRYRSIAAYAASAYLVPDVGAIRASEHEPAPEARFLYQPEDTALRYKPQEVLCLYKPDDVTDSIEQFAGQIKALVIVPHFAQYIGKKTGEANRVLAAFDQVRYLEILADNSVTAAENTIALMELILQHKAFDQLEYLYVRHLTMEQVLQIHERYRNLRSLIIGRIDNQQELALPSPFLSCPGLTLLSMECPAPMAGNELAHLTQLEDVVLFAGGGIPLSDQTLSALPRLRSVFFQTVADTVICRNNSIGMLKIVALRQGQVNLVIDAPCLQQLEVSGYHDLTVDICCSENLELLGIDVPNNLQLRIGSGMRSLKQLDLTAKSLVYGSSHTLPENAVINLTITEAIKLQKGSKKLSAGKSKRPSRK